MRTTGKNVSEHYISRLFGNAYLKVQSDDFAVKGFEVTGIYPVNRHIFDDSEFLPDLDEATDKPTGK